MDRKILRKCEVEWNPSGLEWYNLAGHCDFAKAVVSVRAINRC